jgi:subtilisin
MYNRRSNGRAWMGMAVATGVLGAMLTGVVPAAAAPESPSGWIVVLNDVVTSASTTAQAQTARFGAEPRHVYQHALKGYSVDLTSRDAATLRKDPSVVGVYPDGKVHSTVQTFPTGVDRVDGELSNTISGNGWGVVNADIAIIDTGSGPHPDLNIAGGTNCVNPAAPFFDDNGHGTHVAGTAAARDDADGVVGVAPGARIWSVKVLNAGGGGTFAQVICGIDWVTAQRVNGGEPIEVANMSLAGFGVDDNCGDENANPLHLAICNSVHIANVAYVVAAANSASDANNFVPATYEEVITVSALADFNGLPGGGAPSTCLADVDDTFAFFSNFGRDIDLIAPGVCILSSAMGGGLATFSGTSMASPHVAGAAALFKVINPNATAAQVRAGLRSAGNFNWSNADDPDGVKEPLLNVNIF